MVADTVVAGAADKDHRNARRPLVHVALGIEAVVAEHVAMVAGEENDRVVQDPLFAQRAEDDAQLVIDVGALGVEGPPCIVQLLLRQLGPEIPDDLQAPAAASTDGILPRSP